MTMKISRIFIEFISVSRVSFRSSIKTQGACVTHSGLYNFSRQSLYY